MSDETSQSSMPAPLPVLGYAGPQKPVNMVLLVVMSIVVLCNFVLGSVLAFVGAMAVVAKPSPIPVGILLFGVLMAMPGITAWTRTPWYWRRTYEFLVVIACLCTISVPLFLVAFMRGSSDRDYECVAGVIGGTFGSLDLAAAYLLCRVKHRYQLDMLDTRWRQRVGMLFPVPFVLMWLMFVIAFNYAGT